jgi:hypothetical protein
MRELSVGGAGVVHYKDVTERGWHNHGAARAWLEVEPRREDELHPL